MHLLFLVFLLLTVRKFAVLDRLNLASRKLVYENLTADPDRFANRRLVDTDNRVITLIDPALEILRDQAELTRLGKKQKVTVVLREYKRKESHDCTFVFDPSKNMLNGLHGISYCVGALGRNWTQALRRAGVRHRNAYQSRHTFACWFLTAGANPSFIASQMGHANAQMLYQVYGKWMSDNDNEQLELLNRKIGVIAPLMPQVKSA